MMDIELGVEQFIEYFKKLLFPEEWIKLDLKFSKFEIFSMFLMDKNKEITMTELVEYIKAPMSTATGIADRLVKSGYVIRERSDTDRRIVILKLSDEGTKLIKSLKELISQYLNMILDELTDEEKQLLTKIIFKVIKTLQERLDTEHNEAQGKPAIKKIEIE